MDCVIKTNIAVKVTDVALPVSKPSSLLIQAYGDCVDSFDVPQHLLALDEGWHFFAKPQKV